MDAMSPGGPSLQEEPRSAASSVCKWISHLAGTAGFVFSLWCALMTAFFLGPSVFIVLNIDGYRPADFEVKRLYFIKGEQRTNRTYGEQGAEGAIGGRDEIFRLGEYVPKVVNSLEELKHFVHEGQVLKVMYNPGVRIGELRVLYPDPNFRDRWKQRQKEMLHTAYGPYLLCMAICFLFGVPGRVPRSCVGLFAASAFIILMAWVPALLQLLFA